MEIEMSAWLCSEEHINLIANAALTSDRARTFTFLLDANLRSLEHRYPGRDFLDEWKRLAESYRFRPEAPEAIAARAGIEPQALSTLLVKQCDCFDHQACESDDYQITRAARLVERVRRRAIKEGGGQDGGKLYDRLPWGLD
jgi:hypothetical protein